MELYRIVSPRRAFQRCDRGTERSGGRQPSEPRNWTNIIHLASWTESNPTREMITGGSPECGIWMVRNVLIAWYFSMSGRSIEQVPGYQDMGYRPGECADRRKRSRLQVHWPLRFLDGDTADIVETVTRDLSSDGFYCLARMPFVPGEFKLCTLGVPTSHPRNTDRVLSVECTVRIIRVQAQEDGFYGIGCRIEDYRFAQLSHVHRSQNT